MPGHWDMGDESAEVSTPAQDFNVQTLGAQATKSANPPIPADHAPQTPEFLMQLIAELNRLRQEQSDLFNEYYPPLKPGQVSKTPKYLEVEEYRRKTDELDRKISAIKQRIQSLRILLARPEPEPEYKETPGPKQPTSWAPQQEQLLPVKTGMEPGGSAHFGEAPPVKPKAAQ